MADELGTLEELQARIDWELTPEEQAMAQAALADLSDDARHYGSPHWDSDNAPRMVRSIVLRATVRYVRNPEGFQTSRAGDETLVWAELETTGTASFNEQERDQLAECAGRRNRLFSVPLVAWGPTRRSPRYINPATKRDHCHGAVDDDAVYVQADSGLFPFYAEGEQVV